MKTVEDTVETKNRKIKKRVFMIIMC